jgi:V8-like Glu-specific endopeptidase
MVNVDLVARRGCWAIVAVLALGLPACGAPLPEEVSDEQVGAQTSEIRNGTLYDGSNIWRGVVKLEFWTPKSGWWTCSGQVVSQQTILTAAHCIAKLTHPFDSNPGGLWVMASRPISGGWQTVMPMTFTTVRYNPAFDSVSARYDVGVVIAPSVQPLQNVTSADAALLAKSTPNVIMDALGFGYFGDGAAEFDGKGRSTELRPTYSSVNHEYVYDAPTPNSPEMCHSDSGGPLKDGFQYGILSRGSGDGKCRTNARWATTKDNMSWLKANIVGPHPCLETATLLSCW